uniref:Putative secreted protein n=1 Tax=Anopheles darlingi TaxID=43151 RepID=A0A2M4D816_ANODA
MVVVLVVIVMTVVLVVVGEVKLNSLIASDTIRCSSAGHRDHHHHHHVRLRCCWCCCCPSPKSSIPVAASGGDGGGGGGSDLCFMLHRTQPPAAGAWCSVRSVPVLRCESMYRFLVRGVAGSNAQINKLNPRPSQPVGHCCIQ